MRDTGAVAFGDHGRVFLGSMAGPVREVDARTLRVTRSLDAAPLSSNNYVRVTSDGLLVGAGDKALVGFDLATGHQRWVADLSEDPDWWPCMSFTVAEEVGRLYCGSQFGEVTERTLAGGSATGRRFDTQHGTVGDLAVADGNELVAFAQGISRWRLDGSGPAARLVAPGAAVAGYNDTGQMLVVSDRHAATASVIDVPDGHEIVRLEDDDRPVWLRGDTMLVYHDRGGADLLDVTTGRRWKAVDRDVVEDSENVYPDPSGRDRAWVVFPGSGSFGLDLAEVDTTTGAVVDGSRSPVPGYPYGVTPAPDGHTVWINDFLAEAGDHLSLIPRRVTLARLEVGTGRVLGSIDNVALAAVSTDGRVVVADSFGNITEHDPTSLEPVANLAGSLGPLDQLAFSRDGRLLLAAGDEGTVQLYDSRTWTRLGLIRSQAPTQVVEGWLRPDGRAVAVNGEHGVVEWSLEPKVLAAAACDLAARNMTRTEWATYLPDVAYRRTCDRFPAGT